MIIFQNTTESFNELNIILQNDFEENEIIVKL